MLPDCWYLAAADAGKAPPAPTTTVAIKASGVNAEFAELNELVNPHLSVEVPSKANTSPKFWLACWTTIPPSPAALDPEANKINLSATSKFSVLLKDAVPCTVKLFVITTSPVTLNKPWPAVPPVLFIVKLELALALAPSTSDKILLSPDVTTLITPLEPDVPDDPLEPEVPDEPEDPSEPDVPEEPDEPDEPEVPLDPEDPSEPEVPDEPDEPEVPEVPLDPEVPEDPEDPSVPLDPEVPEVPDEPDEPEVPDVPEEPEVPLDPEDPSVPLDPEVPEVPEVPDEPDEPDVPDEPEDPSVPLDPEVPEVPDEPDEPEVPEDPLDPEDAAFSLVPTTPSGLITKTVVSAAWSCRFERDKLDNSANEPLTITFFQFTIF